MVMKALRDGASGGLTKFILFGFLVMAVGGLVMTDVGGFFRGGVTSTDVAKVGDEKIKIGHFDRTLRRTLSSIGLSPQEAYRLGYINQVLAGEIRSTLLQQASEDNGILVSDKRAAEQIQNLIKPLVREGQDTKDVFSQVLRAQGMSEGEFVESVKRDIGNNLLLGMLNSNFETVSDELALDLYKHQNEKRNVRFVTFLHDKVKNINEPTETQLRNLYNATREAYAREETRGLKIVTLNTEALKKTLSISDEDIKRHYQNNIDFYSVGATWDLDQAIVSSEEQAEKIYKAARRGAPLKEAVEDITSSTSGYLGEQETALDNVLEALKKPIQDTKKGDTTLKPIKSPLGWHVVRVLKINKARKKPLKEVKKDIQEELADSQLIDQQYDLANEVDDLLAGGATLEEVAEEVDLDIVELKPMNQYGLDGKSSDVLRKYAKTKDVILETGWGLEEGETSAIFETAEGKFMAVHLASVTPKSYTPFEEIKKALSKRWMNDQKRAENQEQVRRALNTFTSMKALAKTHKSSIKTKKNIGREDKESKPFLEYTLPNIFEAPLSSPIIADVEGGFAILEVTDFKWPKADPDSVEFKSFKSSLATSAKNEALRSYLAYKQKKHEPMVNERLIEQIYGPSSQAY